MNTRRSWTTASSEPPGQWRGPAERIQDRGERWPGKAGARTRSDGVPGLFDQLQIARRRGGVDGEAQYVTGKSEPGSSLEREETPAWPPRTQWAINAHHRRGCLALVAATQLRSRHRMARNRERASRPLPLRSQAGTPGGRAAPPPIRACAECPCPPLSHPASVRR